MGLKTARPRETARAGEWRRRLDVFFKPKSVAVIGATERPRSVGQTVLTNLTTGTFRGAVYPVNPKRDSLLGLPCYPSVTEIPEPVDLAVVVTPAPAVPGLVRECADAGVRGVVIITAGFRETGPEGAKLEQQILEEARRGQMRLIGPNCLGVMSPRTGLNATFAASMALPGTVAFLSQSGALCTAILDWSRREMVGFSVFHSIGSMLDVGWGDLIDYLGDDPNTRSIVMYMESIGDARSFLSAAREVALNKPIILIKAGRTEEAAKAAASHTGTLAGSDEVIDAAMRRCGVLRVNRISDIFYMAEVLGKQPPPGGPRLLILTNAGGPGVLATDALLTTGGELAELAAATMASLNELLPPHWSHRNPIDILGDAGAERYAHAVSIAAKDPNSDGILVVLTPQGMTEPTLTAEQLKPLARMPGKPILASWMGGATVAAGEGILNEAGIPTFQFPDSAARAFTYMWRYSYSLKGLYETPALSEEPGERPPDQPRVRAMIDAARNAGRTLLTEVESKHLLACYGLPVVETRVAHREDEAARLAGEIGYPVVLKLYSETITHKTDVGGVKLNLEDAAAVRQAYGAIERSVREKVGAQHFQGVSVQPMIGGDGYELILGSSVDAQFGPVLLFGSGGQLVEVYKDRALALPPLNTTLARRMMEQTKVFTALTGVRGRKPVDLAALEKLLVRFSRLVVEQRWIREIDINPLVAGPERIVALDARVVLYPPDVREDQIPRLAIRPYPVQYVEPWVLRDGTPVTLRPIRPEDEPQMVQFHATLSDQSVYLRYFHHVNFDQRTAHERLLRMCFIDYDRQIALVAERRSPETGAAAILAVGRLVKLPGGAEAECAFIVTDRFQRLGLGTELVRRLIEIARAEGVARLKAEILSENTGMQRIFRKLGFGLKQIEATVVSATLEL